MKNLKKKYSYASFKDWLKEQKNPWQFNPNEVWFDIEKVENYGDDDDYEH